MLKIDLLKPLPAEPEPEYDSPNNSEWIVCVDMFGSVSILVAPNIHPSFLENTTTEEIGLPFESEAAPGVYRWTCSFWTNKDWETGITDDMGFDVISSEPLYLPEQTTPSTSTEPSQ